MSEGALIFIMLVLTAIHPILGGLFMLALIILKK